MARRQMAPAPLLCAVLAAAAAAAAAAPHGSPWAGGHVVAQAAALVKKMTFEEKFSMIYGRNAKTDYPQKVWYVGNVPGTPRLGLPPIHLEDGPQGVADGLTNVTQWPSQLTVSMTWNKDLMYRWGAAMGAEQRLKGSNVMLGPDVNLARVPWSGRVFETMGEDPYLASQLVAPLVKGIQSNNISACIKHFIFNNHEVNRQTFSANVDERTGRELYAPAFFAAVDAGVGSLMCAFNRVNNTFSCQNEEVLTSLLKHDGGFRGWVVTDWGAQHDSIPSVLAGLDQQMEWVQDANFTRYHTIGFANPDFRAALLNGTVPSSRLDDMVTRMVEPMLALGMVSNPPQPSTQNTESNAQSQAHFKLAVEIAKQSTVLLKNQDGILPIKTGADGKYPSVALFGNPWYRAGSGSGGVQYTPTAHVPQNAACNSSVGCNSDTAFMAQHLFGAGMTEMTIGNDRAQAGIHPFNLSSFNASKARAEAAAADIAIVIVYIVTGEGMDRTTLRLDDWQDAMVQTVAAANKKTIVVARCSGAFLMPWLDDVRAVLYQTIPGQAAGPSAAAAILGEDNPSGKLTLSFPSSMNETWLVRSRRRLACRPHSRLSL